jgi:hypothetical protein
VLRQLCRQAIMSTRMTSKTMAKTEMNVRIRVRLAPRIVSARKKGAKRTINPAKDLHAPTHDQSPAPALQWFPRNVTTQTMRRTETASRFAAPRTWRHLGRSLLAPGFKKRTQPIPSKMGGDNTEHTLRMLNNHKPCMVGEYASKPLPARR